VAVSERVARRVRRDFPEPGSAPEILRILGELPEIAGSSGAMFGSERLHAAIVLSARGSFSRFRAAVRLAVEDWRDSLVGAGLADEDWPTRLDTEFGPVKPPASPPPPE
jgi:hypothetical protein